VKYWIEQCSWGESVGSGGCYRSYCFFESSLRQAADVKQWFVSVEDSGMYRCVVKA